MKLKFNQVDLLAITVLCFFSSNARPAVYWASANNVPVEQGVRSSIVSVCFVGDALISRPDRVQQVLDYIRWFEHSANIQFNYLGTCAGPTMQPNGNDFYDGDIRVVIPGVLFDSNGKDIFFEVINIPGKGCTRESADPKNPGSSWSNAPWDLTPNRSCLYNLKLGDDPWTDTPYLNHTLHEFGHALGLAHEHERYDVPDVCKNSGEGYGGGIRNGLMTQFDKDSVMNYGPSKSSSCGIVGNYAHTGLSDWDRLALHILYPEDNYVAEYVGTTVVRTTDVLRLRSAWRIKGANTKTVAKDFRWRINTLLVSTEPNLKINLTTPGDYTFRYSYSGILGHPVKYSYKGKITVLTPKAYDQRMATFAAAQLPLL